MTRLNISWKEFQSTILLLIEEGKKLHLMNPKGRNEENKFDDDYRKWREQVNDIFLEAFGKNNSYWIEFKQLHQNNYKLRNRREYEPTIQEIKSLLCKDVEHVQYNLKLFNVCELLTNPSKINLSQRNEYSSEEILNFLLKKLYKLYDDNLYPILSILEGNGIKMKCSREEFEYLDILESRDLVFSTKEAHFAYAKLTLKGKIHVEDKLKIKEQDYSSISDESEIINDKIDKILDYINKLGYGQEIIFDEFQELKDLYPKLKKKNWGELLKGKLIDLGLSQVLNKETVEMIYKKITDTMLELP